MEIVVASGKGGTGKTFVSSNLSLFLLKGRGAVGADCDVEAPDLLLALGGQRELLWSRELWMSRKAVIDYSRCTGCLRCYEVCAFKAIRVEGGKPVVVRELCEGCGACGYACPAGAVGYENTRTGVLYAAVSGSGVRVVTGMLDVGRRNMGEVVYEVKSAAHSLARQLGAAHVVVDAAPGIGCPVVSSLAGADLLLVVVEPTPQSLQGAQRLLQVADSLRVEAYAVVNKWDLKPEAAGKIADKLGVEVLGCIPYDPSVVEAYAQMEPLVAWRPGSPAARSLLEAFEKLKKVAGLD